MQFKFSLVIAGIMLAGHSCQKTEPLQLQPLAATAPVALQQANVPQSFYSLEKINLGGMDQTILISGERSTRPVLLLLHGGPGFPGMPFSRTFNTDLEKHFLVVHWDQRGAGLSYSPGIPLQTMKIEQFISDAHELVDHLKARFGKRKIFLMAHSWGTIIGTQLVKRFPNDFYAYVGAGQIADAMDNERLSFQYAFAKAIASRNLAAIRELSLMLLRYPQKSQQGIEDMLVQRKWLAYFGGVLYRQTGYDSMLLRVNAPEMQLYDPSALPAGLDFSLRALWLEILDTDFIKTASRLNVPVYLLVGRHDYNTPFLLAKKYYDLLKAPSKELIWFEKSAHYPMFEEPAKFNDLMINKVLRKTPLLAGDSR
jgi:pimeloyl-ACP methyl ester carboxylesterase